MKHLGLSTRERTEVGRVCCRDPNLIGKPGEFLDQALHSTAVQLTRQIIKQEQRRLAPPLCRCQFRELQGEHNGTSLSLRRIRSCDAPIQRDV